MIFQTHHLFLKVQGFNRAAMIHEIRYEVVVITWCGV